MIENVLAPEWRTVLAAELEKMYMIDIFTQLRKCPVYYPGKDQIFRAFQHSDYSQIKVVILGQDPYHTAGMANGLAFAVNNDVPVKPPSLVNIYKEVERNIGKFVDRNESDLLGWAKQGVMLLNTVLTVEPGKPLSHANLGWQRFTGTAIQALSKRPTPLVFMLWGSHARSYAKDILEHHLVLQSTHPSPLGANSGPIGSRFTGCRHFEKANNFLKERGLEPIDWSRL